MKSIDYTMHELYERHTRYNLLNSTFKVWNR